MIATANINNQIISINSISEFSFVPVACFVTTCWIMVVFVTSEEANNVFLCSEGKISLTSCYTAYLVIPVSSLFIWAWDTATSNVTSLESIAIFSKHNSTVLARGYLLNWIVKVRVSFNFFVCLILVTTIQSTLSSPSKIEEIVWCLLLVAEVKVINSSFKFSSCRYFSLFTILIIVEDKLIIRLLICYISLNIDSWWSIVWLHLWDEWYFDLWWMWTKSFNLTVNLILDLLEWTSDILVELEE